MKKSIALLSLIFFIVSLSVFAQLRFTPQERLNLLKEKQNLTVEQSASVEEILVKSDEEMKTLRNNENSDRTEFRKIMENSNQEILKVLNEKQKIVYNAMLDERKNRQQQKSNNQNK